MDASGREVNSDVDLTSDQDGNKDVQPPPRKPAVKRPIRRYVVRPTPSLLRAAMRFLLPVQPR